MNPGDLVFCSTKGIIGKSIRWAQHFMPDSEYSKWNHVAILDRYVDGKWSVSYTHLTLPTIYSV